MTPITLILKPNPTRDNVPRTGPAAAAGHVGRDPVDAADSRSLNDRVIATGLARGGKSYFTRERGGTPGNRCAATGRPRRPATLDGDHPASWADVEALDIADIGDFRIAHGDIQGTLAKIKAQAAPLSHLVALGGDHTITIALRPTRA